MGALIGAAFGRLFGLIIPFFSYGSGLFSGVLAWTATREAAKLARFFVYLGVIIALILAFRAGLVTAVHAIEQQIPDIVVRGAAYVLPSNTSICVSTVLVSRVARWVFDWQSALLKQKIMADD